MDVIASLNFKVKAAGVGGNLASGAKCCGAAPD
jgi:hypothetical protein